MKHLDEEQQEQLADNIRSIAASLIQMTKLLGEIRSTLNAAQNVQADEAYGEKAMREALAISAPKPPLWWLELRQAQIQATGHAAIAQAYGEWPWVYADIAMAHKETRATHALPKR